MTNNHHKYLDNRDSHTYLQFTIATGNFWKQRKNVARRGKRSVKGFILLLKTSGKANLSAQAGLRAKSDVFAFIYATKLQSIILCRISTTRKLYN